MSKFSNSINPSPYNNGGNKKKRWWEHDWVVIAILGVAGLVVYWIVNSN